MKNGLKRVVVCCLVTAMLLSNVSRWIVDSRALSIGLFGRISNGMPTDGRVYNIRSAADGRYLDVLGGGVDDGTNVRTNTYNGAAYQEWRIELIDGTSDECMIMDINSKKYLSIYDSSDALGANAWIWHDDGTSGQRFKIVNVYGGSYQFLTESSNYQKALGVDETSHNVQQMASTSTSTYFYIEQASYSKGIHDGVTLLQNAGSKMFVYKDMNLLLDDYAIQESIGDFIPFCNVKYIGDGYYSIFFEDENVCLTVDNSSPSNGDIVKLEEYAENNDGQKWGAVLSNGMYQLQPKSAINSSLFLCSQNTNANSKLIISNLSGVDLNFSLWAPVSVNNDYKSNGLYAALFFDDSHNLSHYKWLNDAVGPLYKKSSTLYSRMALDVVEEVGIPSSQLLNNIEKSKISVIWTHGGIDSVEREVYLSLNPISSSGSSVGAEIHLYASSYKDFLVEYVSEEDISYVSDTGEYDLSSVSCILFAACHSAYKIYTSPDSLNFLTASIYGGVSYAIGFDSSVDCDYIYAFQKTFFEQYEETGSFLSAYKIAIASTSDGSVNKPCLLTSSYRVYYDETKEDKVNIVYN